MNEAEATQKMGELMISVETMERFYNIRQKGPAVFAAMLLSILAYFTMSAVVNFYDFVITDNAIGTLPVTGNSQIPVLLLVILLIIISGAAIYLILRRAYENVHDQEWRKDLEEGALGIIKIMGETNWEDVLRRIGGSKLGFALVAVLQLSYNFIILSFVSFFGLGFALYFGLGISMNVWYALAISAVFTAILGDRTMKKMYGRIWSADILIEELRRFYGEFSQREV